MIYEYIKVIEEKWQEGQGGREERKKGERGTKDEGRANRRADLPHNTYII